LTFDSDKLIALSGVAKMVQQELKDEYLAGLWKKGIIVQLAWMVLGLTKQIGNMSFASRPKTYTAPSWSWASVNGEIYYQKWPTIQEMDQFRELSSLIDYHLDLKSLDQTGQVKSGYVQIRGPLTEVSVSMTASQTFPFCHYRIDINGVLGEHHMNMDVEPGGNGWDKSFIYLALYFTSDIGKLDSKKVVGLLLQPVPGSTKHFSRVGFLETRDPRWTTWCTTPKEIASLAGVDFDSKRGYTIKII
jgi:hypothetical protein